MSARVALKHVISNPDHQQASMDLLKIPFSLAQRHMSLPVGLQGASMLFQKGESHPADAPIALQSLGTHQLVLVNAQQFFDVFKKDFNVKAGSRYG